MLPDNVSPKNKKRITCYHIGSTDSSRITKSDAIYHILTTSLMMVMQFRTSNQHDLKSKRSLTDKVLMFHTLNALVGTEAAKVQAKMADY